MALLFRNRSGRRGRAPAETGQGAHVDGDGPEVTALLWAADPPAPWGDRRHAGFPAEAALQRHPAWLPPRPSPSPILRRSSRAEKQKPGRPACPSPLPEGRAEGWDAAGRGDVRPCADSTRGCNLGNSHRIWGNDVCGPNTQRHPEGSKGHAEML